MKHGLIVAIACLIFTPTTYALRGEAPVAGGEFSKVLTRIAFGSCAKQDKPQPILEQVARTKPDLFIYLGDNMYADTEDAEVFAQAYSILDAKPEFNRLWQTSLVLATWDDHDYGENNVGKNYPLKEKSKEFFLNFWREPKDSPRFNHPGIYADYLFGPPGRRVQILLLDTRTFRDDLKRSWWGWKKNDAGEYYRLQNKPHSNPSKTLLGEQQWQWLETQLRKPADLRIIGSSIQFDASYNGYEAWANFPHEQKKLLRLIAHTAANHVLIISGDVHYAEVSRLKTENTYPLYDFTSSGITQTWKFATKNESRIDGPWMQNNFGLVEIDWQSNKIDLRVFDLSGETQIHREILFNELELGQN